MGWALLLHDDIACNSCQDDDQASWENRQTIDYHILLSLTKKLQHNPSFGFGIYMRTVKEKENSKKADKIAGEKNFFSFNIIAGYSLKFKMKTLK